MKAGFFQNLWASLAVLSAAVLAMFLTLPTAPAEWVRMSGAALALFCALSLVSRYIWLGRRGVLQSVVSDHEGPCVPSWLNTNQLCMQMDGLTGFFRPAHKAPLLPLYVGLGKEFHGRIVCGKVFSTEQSSIRRDDFNPQGTMTGRFQSDQHLESNTPKAA